MKGLTCISALCAWLALQPNEIGAQEAVAPACALVPASMTCMDATPCRPDAQGNVLCLSGVAGPAGSWSLAQHCWQYGYSFACAGTSTDTCKPYANDSACALISSRCSDTVPSTGACAQYDNSYQCLTQPAKTAQVLSCTSGLFDAGMETPAAPPSHFDQAAIAMEVVNEAASYNNHGAQLFSGVAEQCKKGWGGLKDCCKSSSGAMSNSAIMNLVFSAGTSAVKYAGEKAIDLASPYVFDAMYQSSQFTAGLMSNLAAINSANLAQNSGHLLTGTNFTSNGLTLGAYGFTYGTGSFTAFEESSLIGGDINLSPSLGMGPGDGFVSFNPYVFAAMVAIQIIQDLAACEQGEQMLAMHKGASLSVFIDESCSAKIPILDTCIEWTDHYCSFNSVLSKIINTQGKPQLGLAVASCSGLDVEQLGRIDFTRIDFSEFAATQASRAQANLPANIKGNYSPIMQDARKGSAQNINPALPSYP